MEDGLNWVLLIEVLSYDKGTFVGHTHKLLKNIVCHNSVVMNEMRENSLY